MRVCVVGGEGGKKKKEKKRKKRVGLPGGVARPGESRRTEEDQKASRASVQARSKNQIAGDSDSEMEDFWKVLEIRHGILRIRDNRLLSREDSLAAVSVSFGLRSGSFNLKS